jgi:hypothetical protein
MLEQPPERDLLEIQAEALAAAQSQIRPTHGCIRALVWMAPFFVTLIVFVVLVVLSNLGKMRGTASESTLFLITMLIALIVSYGIGLFDALLSSSVHDLSDDSRKTKISMHAVQFMLYQVLIVPTIGLILAAIIPVIFAIFANSII